MIDKFIGFVAFAILAGYMAVIVGFGPDLDPMIVVGIVLVLAGYDFYSSTLRERGDGL